MLAALAMLTGACAGASEPPAAQPEPDGDPFVLGVEVEAAEPAAPAEPEPSLEDRWRAPFAVRSSGRTAARPPRTTPAIARSGTPDRRDDRAEAEAEEAPSRTLTVVPAGERGSVAAERETPAPAVESATVTRERGAADEGSPAVAGVRTHQVEWGETWLGLARRYGVRSAELAALNPDVDPERLRAGEVLRVPAAEAREAQRAAPDARRTHTVVSGDSLWGISRRYGVSIESIRELNRLSDDRVRLGQVLIIP